MMSGKSTNTTGVVTPAFLYAQVSSAFVIAGAIGAFSCGYVAELLGRRNGLLANHFFAILGGAVCAPCVRWHQPAMLFIGRILMGLNCGITIGIASLYLTEIAPTQLRGAIGACNQLAITLGIAWSYIMTLDNTLNTADMWPIAVAFVAIPAIISLIFLPFCPESPRFLMLRRKNQNAARSAFTRLNPKGNPDTFFTELREEEDAAKNQPKFKFSQLFVLRDLRMPVMIACLIQVLQQLSGINAVITYSSSMLMTAGVDEDYIQYCVLAIGVINVILTVIALPLLERAGRRTLILWPTVALGISLFLMTITVNMTTSISDLQTKKIMGAISVLLIIVYICGFALGLGPVPALIVSEIFRQGPRAAAYSLSQGLQWLCNLMVLCSYPSINAAIQGYSFIPFLLVVILCWTFFYLFMPETKNRSFEEIARELASGKVVAGRKKNRSMENHNATLFSASK